MGNLYNIIINLINLYKTTSTNTLPTITIFSNGDKKYIYRAAPNISKYMTTESCIENIMTCSDTGKQGIYFATVPILSISMTLEYRCPLEIGVFEIIEDIELTIGKYEFRKLHPERYFDSTGELIRGVDPLPSENISHMESILPIMRNKKTNQIEWVLPDKYDKRILEEGKEYFLTEKDIPKIKFVGAYRFDFTPTSSTGEENLSVWNFIMGKSSPKTFEQWLFDYIKTNDYPFYLDKYIEDKILVPII